MRANGSAPAGNGPGEGARPRLLFLAQVLPFPPDTGVSIRTYHVLRLLAGAHDVTCLCFYRAGAHASDEERARSVAVLRELAHVEAFPIPQESSRIRLLWDHLRSLVARRVYTHFVYRSAPFRSRLATLLDSTRFDVAHVDSLDLCAYIPLLRDTPVVCVHHNVESRLLRRRAGLERSAWRRLYLHRQATLYEREERRWCERVALNVTVSEGDRAELERIAPRGRFLVVPNGADTDELRPVDRSGRAIVYIGGTEWLPNLDALRYFGEEILPILREGGPVPPVRWVGRASEEERAKYRDAYGVELTGYVEEIGLHVRSAACTVVPLRIGGGTRLKITTAWALGKAVVSTSVGCEGLAAVDGENILIRDTPHGFATAVRSVLEDPALRRRLEEGARRTAEERYSWRVIGDTMLPAYRSLFGRNDPPRLLSKVLPCR